MSIVSMAAGVVCRARSSPMTAAAACVGAESQWILFIHNTTSTLKPLYFFSTP